MAKIKEEFETSNKKGTPFVPNVGIYVGLEKKIKRLNNKQDFASSEKTQVSDRRT